MSFDEAKKGVEPNATKDVGGDAFTPDHADRGDAQLPGHAAMRDSRSNRRYTSESDSDEDELEPTRYATSPRSTYVCHVVSRVVVLVLTVVAVALTCVSYGVAWARMTVSPPWSPDPERDSFRIFLWRLSGPSARSGGPRPGRGAIEFADEHQWINTGTRICMILMLAFAVVALVLSAVFLACRCAHERQRRADDKERVEAHDAYRQQQQQQQQQEREDAGAEAGAGSPQRAAQQHERSKAEGEYPTEKGAGKGSRSREATQTAASPPPPPASRRHRPKDPRKPASFYIQREQQRRQLDFNLGVATFVFLLATVLVGIAAMVYFAVYIRGDLFIADIEDNLDDGGANIDEDDLENHGKVTFLAGFWLVVPVLAVSLVALVLLVISALTGFWLCGPRAVPAEKSLGNEPDNSGRSNTSPQRSPGRDYGREGNAEEGEEMRDPSPQTQRHQPQQRAVHGIPVALPGPPVESLEIAGDEGNNANDYHRGNSGGAPRQQLTANAPHDDSEDSDSGVYQRPYLPNNAGEEGGGETVNQRLPATTGAHQRAA